jgi:hypothetical protein
MNDSAPASAPAPSPERIAVTFTLTVDDYASYAAAVDRRSRGRSGLASLVLFFGAVPAALLFRSLASHWLGDADAIELAGQFSLFAYTIGVVAAMIAGAWMTRHARRRYAERVESGKTRTIEFDRSGVTGTSRAAQFKWQWTAFSQCTFQRGLVLIWDGDHTAIPIPGRSFGSEAACAAALAFIRAQIAAANAAMQDADPGSEAARDRT